MHVLALLTCCTWKYQVSRCLLAESWRWLFLRSLTCSTRDCSLSRPEKRKKTIPRQLIHHSPFEPNGRPMWQNCNIICHDLIMSGLLLTTMARKNWINWGDSWQSTFYLHFADDVVKWSMTTSHFIESWQTATNIGIRNSCIKHACDNTGLVTWHSFPTSQRDKGGMDHGKKSDCFPCSNVGLAL